MKEPPSRPTTEGEEEGHQAIAIIFFTLLFLIPYSMFHI